MSGPFRAAAIEAAMRAGALLHEHLGGRREVSYKGGPTGLLHDRILSILEAVRRR